MLLNSDLSTKKFRYSTFGVQYSLFDIHPALKGHNHTARGRVSAANASERRPGTGVAIIEPPSD